MIKDILKLAQEFTDDPTFVFINEDGIRRYSDYIKRGISKDDKFLGTPPIKLIKDEKQRVNQIILYELLAGAVNYKYWYGKYNIRPNDSCANKMYETLDKAFTSIVEPISVSSSYCSAVTDVFGQLLCQNRFPMVKERISHLQELKQNIVVGRGDPNNPPNASFFINLMAEDIIDGTEDVENWLNLLIYAFPGYSQDMFLKRAFLFFMMLYRRMGWFKDSIHKLPIPADYQIPKILNTEGCLQYREDLREIIRTNELIPKGSLMECEIRASSIIACRKIAEQCDVTMCKIDEYIWLNRKKYRVPFHLTMTTDY
jgi:hypothetical protein